jgi:hypothetical protein
MAVRVPSSTNILLGATSLGGHPELEARAGLWYYLETALSSIYCSIPEMSPPHSHFASFLYVVNAKCGMRSSIVVRFPSPRDADRLIPEPTKTSTSVGLAAHGQRQRAEGGSDRLDECLGVGSPTMLERWPPALHVRIHAAHQHDSKMRTGSTTHGSIRAEACSQYLLGASSPLFHGEPTVNRQCALQYIHSMDAFNMASMYTADQLRDDRGCAHFIDFGLGG